MTCTWAVCLLNTKSLKYRHQAKSGLCVCVHVRVCVCVCVRANKQVKHRDYDTHRCTDSLSSKLAWRMLTRARRVCLHIASLSRARLFYLFINTSAREPVSQRAIPTFQFCQICGAFYHAKVPPPTAPPQQPPHCFCGENRPTPPRPKLGPESRDSTEHRPITVSKHTGLSSLTHS